MKAQADEPDVAFVRAIAQRKGAIDKLCLFGGMLALAALNRFWLVPSLIRDNELRGPAAGFLKLRRHILGEQGFGFSIILLVSAIGTIEPAINSSQQ